MYISRQFRHRFSNLGTLCQQTLDQLFSAPICPRILKCSISIIAKLCWFLRTLLANKRFMDMWNDASSCNSCFNETI